MDKLQTQTLGDLAIADRPTLVCLWAETFGTPAPLKISLPYLRRFLAFELQARRSGGLPKRFASEVEAKAGRSVGKPAPGLAPGGRLLREWNGTTHVVEVTDEGFLWQGETWASLSAIARAITGAHWSGPRFFGLADRRG